MTTTFTIKDPMVQNIWTSIDNEVTASMDVYAMLVAQYKALGLTGFDGDFMAELSVRRDYVQQWTSSRQTIIERATQWAFDYDTKDGVLVTSRGYRYLSDLQEILEDIAKEVIVVRNGIAKAQANREEKARRAQEQAERDQRRNEERARRDQQYKDDQARREQSYRNSYQQQDRAGYEHARPRNPFMPKDVEQWAVDMIKELGYRTAASQNHPDRGGDHNKAAAINRAKEYMKSAGLI